MAQLMLHRDVLKNFGRLPSKVQKKAYELIQDFETDSKSLGTHLEPVNAAKDPKVRSARLGLDYRAIVITPEQGDTFVLMHIDHHDEAYQWCRNRRFEAHGALGVLQVFDVPEAVTTERQTSVPKEEAPVYVLDGLSNQQLYQAGVPEALIPAVRAVRDDDAFEKLMDYLPREAAQVLFGVAAGMGLDEAIEEMLGQTEKPPRPASPGDFSHLAETASQDLVLVAGAEHLREILAEDIEEWRVFLHPYQRKLVEKVTKGPMKISGAAGTGKTVALMHRAAYLAGKCEKGERVLITTFTTNLAITIKGLMAKLAPRLIDRIEVTNLHQLARTICFRGGWKGKIAEHEDIDQLWGQVLKLPECLDLPFDGDFVRSEWEQIIAPMEIDSEEAYLTAVRSGRGTLRRKQRKLLWKAVREFHRGLARRNLVTFDGLIHQARLLVEEENFPGFRHVLVDEIQDFNLEGLRLIAALSPIASQASDPLCVVGDGHQRIYNPNPVPLSRAGIEVRGRSHRLKINYRTTEEIRRWAQSILHGVEVDDLDGERVLTQGDHSLYHGVSPEVVRCAEGKERAQAVARWIAGLLSDGEIASHEICFSPPDPTVVKQLESDGIKTLELKPRQMDPGQSEPGVRYGTKQRIKGLEFKAVAILDVRQESDNSERFVNYVAATRARERLLVVSLGTNDRK